MSKKKEINIPIEKKIKCNAIIQRACASVGSIRMGSVVAGMVGVDIVLITQIQKAMIIELGKVFKQELSKAATEAILNVTFSESIVRGNTLNAVSAVAQTKAIGWIVADSFYKDKYRTIIIESPVSEAERKETVSTDKERENLIARANEFFDGDKNVKANEEEYTELFKSFEKFLMSVSKDDPIYNVYYQLMDLK